MCAGQLSIYHQKMKRMSLSRRVGEVDIFFLHLLIDWEKTGEFQAF